MPNPLQSGALPPVPIPDGGQNALQQGQPPQGAPGAPGAMAAPAPPSHQQTVAALRHFHAVIDEVQTLLKDPAAGKSDMKTKIIDGVVKLVSERMLSASQAVVQLSKVPSDPLEQRKWLQALLAQNATAANAVVDHHAAGHDGTLDWNQEGQAPHPSPDQHLDHMAALNANYGGGR